MNFLFTILNLLHLAVWGFILFAFLNPKTAYLNLYYFVPLVYIVQILPFHFFTMSKEMIYPNDWRSRSSLLSSYLVLPIGIGGIVAFFDKFSYFNPLSWQGMMVFGAISSAWSLRLNKGKK